MPAAKFTTFSNGRRSEGYSKRFNPKGKSKKQKSHRKFDGQMEEIAESIISDIENDEEY